MICNEVTINPIEWRNLKEQRHDYVKAMSGRWLESTDLVGDQYQRVLVLCLLESSNTSVSCRTTFVNLY
jgi:hypothetical protein